MTALSYLYLPSQNMPVLVCPAHLTADNRLDFRRDALNALEAAIVENADAVELDLSNVVEIDASGLGVFILIHKRARERGLRTRMHNVPGIVEKLFEETHMGPLFDIVRD